MAGIFNYLAEGQTSFNPMRAIASVLSLFMAAFMVELIFRWYSAPFRGRIPWETPAAFLDKIGRLLLKTVIDLTSTLIFIALPMTTATARYLYRWVAAISIIARCSPDG